MKISLHRHDSTNGVHTEATQGMIMNMGWRYDLIVGLLDTVLLHGTLRKLPQRTTDLAQLQPGEVVLDVGCGTGTLALEASRRVGITGQVHGIDPGPKQIKRASAKARQAHLPIDFQVGVIERLPFSEHTFDVVFSIMMLHHLPDDLKRSGIAEIARVLKAGGRLVIVDFKRAEKQQNKVAPLGAGLLGLQDLPALLQEAGFEHIESGEIAFPRLMGLEGAGFIRAHRNLAWKSCFAPG